MIIAIVIATAVFFGAAYVFRVRPALDEMAVRRGMRRKKA